MTTDLVMGASPRGRFKPLGPSKAGPTTKRYKGGSPMTVQYNEALQAGTTFNGWANKSTWATVLWLTNEESTDKDLRAIALNTEMGAWDKYQALKDYLSDLLLGEYSPIHLNNGKHSFASGLIIRLVSQGLREIDYQAIIESVED
jgi:hypothetical protein